MTFGPQIISADMNYDHDTMESDAIEYIRDLEDDYSPTDDGSWEGR
jgi:malate synthase